MEKEKKTLNLCEKLAGCPEGTKLWSPVLGECEFVRLCNDMGCHFVVRRGGTLETTFDKSGHFFDFSEECLIFPSKDNRDWDSWERPKVKPERFDPETLQPFDKILVRNNGAVLWECKMFECFDKGFAFPVSTLFGGLDSWKYCVPYNDDTKHLAGSCQEAPEYYRWWEDEA